MNAYSDHPYEHHKTISMWQASSRRPSPQQRQQPSAMFSCQRTGRVRTSRTSMICHIPSNPRTCMAKRESRQRRCSQMRMRQKHRMLAKICCAMLLARNAGTCILSTKTSLKLSTNRNCVSFASLWEQNVHSCDVGEGEGVEALLTTVGLFCFLGLFHRTRRHL